MTTTPDRFIETSTGRRFYIEHSEFDHTEIAASTSKLCRFTGHCSRFYSVAEHMVLVAGVMSLCELGDPFEGLMHDGAEMVVNDIASPVKSGMPGYKEFEKPLDRRLRAQYGLPLEKTAGCATADWVALLLEAKQLLPSGGKSFGYAPPEARAIAEKYPLLAWVLGHNPVDAERQWLRHFKRLYNPEIHTNAIHTAD